MTSPAPGASREPCPSTGRPEASEVADPLIALLRRELGAPALDWAEPPVLLGDGVTARAFSLRLSGAPAEASGPLVCRVFCDGGEELGPDQVAVEMALQNALADAGFPAPRVLARGAALGLPLLIMERVPGRDAFGPVLIAITVATAAELAGARGMLPLALLCTWVGMAYVLRRLHRVPGADVARALSQVGVPPERLGAAAALDALAARIGEDAPPGSRDALAWLRANRPSPAEPPVVAHGDFWFGNLMLSLRRVALLDWTQAGLGQRELDLGWMSIQHYSRVPLPIPDPLYDWLWLLVRPFTWLLMAPIRSVYRLGGGVDAGRLRYFTAFCALRSLVQVERLRRGATRGDPPAELRAWGSPHTRALLRWRLRRITGARIGSA